MDLSQISNIDFRHWWELFLKWLPIIHIPIVGAIVGWFSNWKAIKLTFWPVEFIGIRPYLGWQGIIPAQAAKMAALSVDLMTAKLINIKEVFARLQPDQTLAEINRELQPTILKIADEAMQAQYPLVWSKLPARFKEQLYSRSLSKVSAAMHNIMAEVQHHIHDLLGLKRMAVETLMADKRLINRIFMNVGKAEFRFLIISGWYLGLFFGLIQMWICIYYNPWWMLPVFGAIAGYVTNWIALKLIFWPVKPIQVLGMSLQGVFIKRQEHVAKEYAKIISEKILTTERMIDYIVRGNNPAHFSSIIRKYTDATIDELVESYPEQLQFILNDQKRAVLKEIVHYRFMEETPIILTHAYDYATEALQIEHTLYNKMAALSEEEFIGFLRPVFQEDETKLLILGGVLGFVAGAIQYWAMT